jgi:cytochrome P450
MGAFEEQFMEHYDHFDPAQMEDAHAMWDTMRERCPIARSDAHGGFWVATRYEDITAISHDIETFSSRQVVIAPIGAMPGPPSGTEFPPGDPEMTPVIFLDPPEHAKLRRLLVAAFSPKEVAKWKPQTEEIANTLIDKFADADQIDAAFDYSQQIPITLMARLLGIEEELHDTFARWARLMVEFGAGTEAAAMRIEMAKYLQEKIAYHRSHPADDMISYLLSAEINGVALSDIRVLVAVSQLLIAGIDTTWSSIGSSLHYLATHPSERRWLVEALDDEDDQRWVTAIEEFLRAFAPVALGRYVARDVELHGQELHPGDLVLMEFPSANRDQEVFDRPDEVILDRANNRHVTFGSGNHRCLGNHLARMEMLVGLQAFLRRIPEFHLADDAAVPYTAGITRGPRTLPLVIDR